MNAVAAATFIMISIWCIVMLSTVLCCCCWKPRRGRPIGDSCYEACPLWTIDMCPWCTISRSTLATLAYIVPGISPATWCLGRQFVFCTRVRLLSQFRRACLLRLLLEEAQNIIISGIGVYSTRMLGL